VAGPRRGRPISRDGEAALVALAIDSDDRDAAVNGVRKIRAYLAAHRPTGLRCYVTGPRASPPTWTR
jgi:hypothetical protein